MCLYPRLIVNKKYKPNKKNGGIVPAISDNRVLAVPVGCGNCIECKKQKAKEWQVRLTEDVRHNTNGKFITLTFSNESIAKLYQDKKLTGLKGYELDNAAATLAVHLFRERWRKKYKKSIRHWLVTELGHNGTENIHLHGILWTDKTEDIEKIWQYGYVWKGKIVEGQIINYVNEQTVNYITKYINKVDFDHKYYKSKVLTSAGIGGGYMKREDKRLNKYIPSETNELYTNRQGFTFALPTYLRNKIYTEEEREKLWIEKLDKEERYILGRRIDISESDEMYYRALEEARKKNKRLGYGTSEKDWQREKYEEQRRLLLQEQRIKNIKDTLPHGAKKELYETWGSTSMRGITPNLEDWKITLTEDELKQRDEMRAWREILAE